MKLNNMTIKSVWLDAHEDKIFRYLNGTSNPLGWHDQREIKVEFENRFNEICHSITNLIGIQTPGIVIPIPSSRPVILEIAMKVSALLGSSWELNDCFEKIDPSKRRRDNIHSEYDNIRLSKTVDLERFTIVLIDDIIRTGSTISNAERVISSINSQGNIFCLAVFDLRNSAEHQFKPREHGSE